MKKISNLRELQEIEIKILEEVELYCKKNSLTLLLSSGTLLGAIRHKSFIPWDDDIDIMMFRDDYESLLAHFNDNGGRYKVMSYKNTPGYYYPYAKVVDTDTILKEELLDEIEGLGIFIDIFPIDNIPDSKIKRKIFINRVRFYRMCQHFVSGMTTKAEAKNKTRAFLKTLIRPIMRLMPVEYPAKKTDKLAVKNNRKKEGCIYIGGIQDYDEIIPREHMENTTKVTFEGKKYTAPKGYDYYLTSLYGDYMQLPPIEKRVVPHITKYFWKNNRDKTAK